MTESEEHICLRLVMSSTSPFVLQSAMREETGSAYGSYIHHSSNRLDLQDDVREIKNI